MEENEVSNSDKFKHWLCYIPFVSIVLFFTENDKSEELMKHIKYSTFLLIVYLFLNFILLWIFFLKAWWILFIIYAWITGFLWWKAYNWEDVQLDYIDDLEKKVKENMNEASSKWKTQANSTKKDETKKEDEDILDF